MALIDEEEAAFSKCRSLSGFWHWVSIVFPAVVILLGINRVFDFRFFIGYMMYDMTYYYLVMAIILSLTYLQFPPKTGLAGSGARWSFRIDKVIFFFIFGTCLYFSVIGYGIIYEGWIFAAPWYALIMGVPLWFLLIEAVRRTAGMVLAVVVTLISFYPLIAEHMPGPLYGFSMDFLSIARYHIFTHDSAVGLLMKVFSDTVMGYILFGCAVIATGGAKFLLNLSFTMVGRTRGGTAKVAAVASAMFGSISGSAMTNVITTGSVTIPAMKRSGIAPYFAGAVEATSSTAGPLMPPIMGAAAFVMATFLGIPYPVIAFSAAIPALLYYIGVLTQIDGYAAQHDLKGVPASEIPSLWETLKRGWLFIPTVVVLIYVLFILRLVNHAPYIATVVMLILAQIQKENRFTRETLLKFMKNTGRTFITIMAVMCGIGLVMGALGVTGLAVSLSRELMMLAGGNLALILIFGAVAGFIMGMGMSLIAVYIFLAIVLAPALTMAGLDPVASHLFLMYVAMLSSITPPVAVCAFVAASIAHASPMKIAFTACRLGAVVFFIPFFFVIEPALILRGDIMTIIRVIITAAIGIFIMASAFEGYMIGIGKLWPKSERSAFYSQTLPLRIILGVTGFMIAFPVHPWDIIGLIAGVVILIPTFIMARRRRVANILSLRLTGDS